MNAAGMYVEGDYDLADKWTVTAGLRYTEDDKDTTQRGVVPCGQAPGTFPPEYADIRKAGHEGGDFIFVRQR